MIYQPEYRAARSAVALFARAPDSPDAKTRLKRDLGVKRAEAIYGWMIRRSLELRPTSASEFDWFVYVDDRSGAAWFRRNAICWDIRVQSAGCLGDRLENAFASLFEAGYEKVVIVGCDIPELGARHLTMASCLLKRGSVVIGPCGDGGYYLIGQRAPGGRLFAGIEWGGPDVYRESLRLAAEAELKVASLPFLDDIDTGEDWQALLGRLARRPAARTRVVTRSRLNALTGHEARDDRPGS